MVEPHISTSGKSHHWETDNASSGEISTEVAHAQCRQLLGLCYDNHNDVLRQRYGEDIKRNVDKETIIDLARMEGDLRDEYIREAETEDKEPYDLVEDPDGVYRPAVEAYRWASAHPKIVLPQSDAELAISVSEFVEAFRNYVENERGWMILWNDEGTAKNEPTFQALIMQTVSAYARANHIDISAEANIGRWPVDFKLAAGHHARVLIEAKLARNTRFWHGLEKQLPEISGS